MAWRDDLLEAKFDGMTFLYEEVRTRIGRRTVVNEFPKRDTPSTEDMGRKARRFTIRGFFIGENYMQKRENLIYLVEEGGDHIFLHPYRGGDTPVKVEGEVDIQERHDKGRYVQFTMTLVESGVEFPLIPSITLPRIQFLAPSAILNLGAPSKFNLLKAIGDVLRSIANGIGKANSAIRKINGKIDSALNLVESITDQINDLDKNLTELINTPGSLLNTLTALVSALVNLVKDFLPPATVAGIKDRAVYQAELLLDIVDQLFVFESEPEIIPTLVEQNEIERKAHAAISDAVKGTVLAAGTEALATVPIASAKQARLIRDNLTQKYEVFSARELDTAAQEFFAALKAEMVRHFNSQAASLPDVTERVYSRQVNSLVLAYNLYGDSDREDDIIRRNREIANPALLPAGIPIEVVNA